jgi:hypothetical protein
MLPITSKKQFTLVFVVDERNRKVNFNGTLTERALSSQYVHILWLSADSSWNEKERAWTREIQW